ncbi:hypothetical protein [Pantoea ananatis]|uniref:hypothetical protein n=1 Tax=Pantoea ananas TaxID=553 RepID=UPI000CF4F551|nr:hypothetical protein [Pantoea ananatis]MDJ0030963.1 hypothetical protein [Pantoea ananatis]PQL02020.1 hypothetical protein CG435_00420 [Pantoea ananatis]
MKTGYMTFFSVNKCGLYKVSDENSYGCELSETFSLISEWVKGKSLSSTMPWDEGSKKHFANCYCQDIYKDEASGDYLLVLWKSDSDNTGSLWGAPEDGKLGSGSVIKYASEVKGKKVIWGRPCYYWVIPEFDTVVSLKFDNSLCDSGLFQEYVESAICNRAKHPDRTVEKTEKGFARISFNEGEESYKFRYTFNMKLKSVDTANAELIKIVPKITHIIKRETIKINPKNERSDWVNTFNSLLPFVSSKAKARKRNIEIKAEAKPSIEEVRTIIEAHSSEERDPKAWDNVGFLTDNGVAWVDKYRLRDIIYMPLESSDIFAASDVYKRISEKRKSYLKPIAEKSRKTA